MRAGYLTISKRMLEWMVEKLRSPASRVLARQCYGRVHKISDSQ